MLSRAPARTSVIDLRKTNNMPLNGIAASNIRRQLKRLRDIFLVEKVKNNYRITEFNDLKTIYDEKIQKFLVESIRERIFDYLDDVDQKF